MLRLLAWSPCPRPPTVHAWLPLQYYKFLPLTSLYSGTLQAGQGAALTLKCATLNKHSLDTSDQQASRQQQLPPMVVLTGGFLGRAVIRLVPKGRRCLLDRFHLKSMLSGLLFRRNQKGALPGSRTYHACPFLSPAGAVSLSIVRHGTVMCSLFINSISVLPHGARASHMLNRLAAGRALCL